MRLEVRLKVRGVERGLLLRDLLHRPRDGRRPGLHVPALELLGHGHADLELAVCSASEAGLPCWRLLWAGCSELEGLLPLPRWRRGRTVEALASSEPGVVPDLGVPYCLVLLEHGAERQCKDVNEDLRKRVKRVTE